MQKNGLPVILISILMSTVITTKAQNIPEQYLQEALANNLVLKEKKITLEKSLISLQKARSLFLPTSWLEGQYTLSQGGRSIDIPVGDLVNPVYKTLNQLTNSNSFPMVSNTSEQLNPNNFYDLRIKTTMPIINPNLKVNRDIQQQEIQLRQTEIDAYKRELIKAVKTAYFNYLMTGNAIIIYQNALEVVNQQLKVNQSLLKNGKGLPAYVSRAESEVRSVESQLQSAINEQQNAKAYFNFLLNKPLSDSIQRIEVQLAETLTNLAVDTSGNVSGREELKSLSLAKAINQNVLKMNKDFRKPRLNAFLDLAAQDFNFKVTHRSFFYLGGLQLQVPLFTGKRNLYTIHETELEARSIELDQANTESQLQLSALVSRNNSLTAYANYQAAQKQAEAAQQYFKLINRGFKEGVNSFIEFLDARNQLTNAKLETNINLFKLLSAAADHERQTASYSFK